MVKIRAEINAIETKITMEKKISETQAGSLKSKQIDRTLARLIKKKDRGLKSIKLEIKKKLQRTLTKQCRNA